MAVPTQRHGQCEKGLYVPASTAGRQENLARASADFEALRPQFFGHDHVLNLAEGESNKSGATVSSSPFLRCLRILRFLRCLRVL